MSTTETTTTQVVIEIDASAFGATIEYTDNGDRNVNGDQVHLIIPVSDPNVDDLRVTLSNSELADLGNLLTEAVTDIQTKRDTR